MLWQWRRTMSSPAPFEGNYKFSCNHSRGKLCQVMLAYKLPMQQQYDWAQKLPTENKELLDEKGEMSTWRDWTFSDGNIPMETLPNLICETTTFLTMSSGGSCKLFAQKKTQINLHRNCTKRIPAANEQIDYLKKLSYRNKGQHFLLIPSAIHCLICQSS